MKQKINYLAIMSLGLGIFFTSCGPSQKLLDSEAKVDKLQKENTSTIKELNECNTKVKNLKNVETHLLNENSSVHSDLIDVNAVNKESQLTIADQTKRLKNLQSTIQNQKEMMTKLKNTVSDALMNYKTDELNVYYKDGNIFVSLEEKLLFKSGSDMVDPKGVEALKTLAKVLNSTKDISVMIEGHTDNIPIKTPVFEDNWDLSTARATSIVRILTSKENGFDPIRITASGKGKFQPVKTNETVEGRAGNRRTEIILSPDLKELFSLLY